MGETPPKIVVAGDVAIDWLHWSVEPKDTGAKAGASRPNWMFYTGRPAVACGGGALLLARMVEAATQTQVATHHLEQLENIPPSKVLHSISALSDSEASDEEKDPKDRVWRVQEFCGFAGPDPEAPGSTPVAGDPAEGGLVVLDDAGNGFRNERSAWPCALEAEGKTPLVVLKMSRPLDEGKLWDLVRRRHGDRLVVVIHANDLREFGASIGRRRSWEQTAQDFVRQMAYNRALDTLAGCGDLVVRFGLEGAIHYTRRPGGAAQSRLYYDPTALEDGYRDRYPGGMQGLACAFVAALTRRLAAGGLQAVGEGVRDGLQGARRLMRLGFGSAGSEPAYPVARLFEPIEKREPFIADIELPRPDRQDRWTILAELAQKRLVDVARNTLIAGTDDVLRRVPVLQVGGLRTVDRSEIESYQSIQNLMRQYLDSDKPPRPLCVAVFGPPGSGKSFGVTQIARHVAPKLVEELTFNMAQFVGIRDLVAAFHKVRDKVLARKVPLVFFDEFDCAFQGKKLGWLKYLLAPMQDGKFQDGDTLHPIGKAILVFAGGTSSTLKDFSGEQLRKEEPKGEARLEPREAPRPDSPGETTPEEAQGARSLDLPRSKEAETARQEFRDAKGPDFLSRLRGYVDILGPNRRSNEDRLYMIRRAIILRSFLEEKAKNIFQGGKVAAIDDGVLRALLWVREFKHGVRSMMAIVEMSMLSGRRRFEPAALPPAEQLDLHVDGQAFWRLVHRDVLLGEARERLAEAIHRRYCEDQRREGRPTATSGLTWEELSEHEKNQNRGQADEIPRKLQSIGYGFSPSADPAQPLVTFSEHEVEALAEMEHERWLAQKTKDGWSHGDPRDDVRKHHPCVLPWSKLPDEEKDKDRRAVRAIPELLAQVGFRIERLD